MLARRQRPDYCPARRLRRGCLGGNHGHPDGLGYRPNHTIHGRLAVAAEGTFRDSTALAIPDPAATTVQLRLVYNRAGVYDVIVHADRYQPWTRPAVRVNPAGFCSTVINVPLIARLVPVVALR
ncbi:MAG TPA: hypothetical protein VHE78_17120 [Gemmatimonadaceae bacterium]|nr:hypothetical protein [Gemmatimonadaceae bacterium]